MSYASFVDNPELQLHLANRYEVWHTAFKQALSVEPYKPSAAIEIANQAAAALDKDFGYEFEETGPSPTHTKPHHAELEFDGVKTSPLPLFDASRHDDGYYAKLAQWVYNNGLGAASAKRLRQTFFENDIESSSGLPWTVKSVQTFIARYL